MMRIKLITGTILPLVIGTLIYIFWRTAGDIRLFKWIDASFLKQFVDPIRLHTMPFASLIPEWIRYSLPDGLWVFSYVCLSLLIWRGYINRKAILWMMIIPLIAVMSEFAQHFKALSGTFDILDIGFYLAGTFAPMLLFKNLFQPITIKHESHAP